jgi:hypothetical protein
MAAILAAGTPAGNAARGCPLTTGQVSELLHVRVHLYRPSADVLCMFAPPGTPKDQLQQSRPLVAVVPFPDPDPSTPRTLKAARHRLVGNPHLYPGPTTWGRDAFIALYDGGPAYAFSHKLMTLVVPVDQTFSSAGRMGLLRSLMTLEFRARPDLRPAVAVAAG